MVAVQVAGDQIKRRTAVLGKHLAGKGYEFGRGRCSGGFAETPDLPGPGDVMQVDRDAPVSRAGVMAGTIISPELLIGPDRHNRAELVVGLFERHSGNAGKIVVCSESGTARRPDQIMEQITLCFAGIEGPEIRRPAAGGSHHEFSGSRSSGKPCEQPHLYRHLQAWIQDLVVPAVNQ